MNLSTAQATWPPLERFGLPKARAGFIGGSDANIIFGGDRERIIRLWQEKRGELAPHDLTTVLPVMLGNWTEDFNRQWYERLSGEEVCKIGLEASCSDRPWRRCTLDGYVEDARAVWEAKHTNAFANRDEMLERYMPQLQHNMAVTKAQRAILSVIFGNHKYEIVEVESDWLYQLELLDAECDFWDCVQTGREPVLALPPLPPRPVGVREVCLEGNNSWASAAADWLTHRDAAKVHSGACAQIKGMVEPDVSRAFGHGIEAKRSKAGAISIKELAK